MKQKKVETKKLNNDFDTPLKQGFDKVYQMILANGLFVLLNLHILLVFLFLEPGNIVLFYIIFGVLSVNVTPSYVALTKTLKLPASEEQKVMKDYFKFYRKDFQRSFILGLMGIVLMVNLLTLSIFFLTQSMVSLSQIFQGIFFIVLTVTIAFAYLGGEVEMSLGETIKVGLKNLFSLLPGAVAFIVFGILSLYFGGILRVLIIIGFSSGAIVQAKLSNKVMIRIKSKKL